MTAGKRAGTDGILFTDHYQLTMAQLYFRLGIHEQPAQFDHFFRSYPDYGRHQAGYCINAGLEWLVDWMDTARFRDEDIAYLGNLTGTTGRRVFADDFLDWLGTNGSFEAISLEAIPEGRVVHPNIPLTVVRGPLAMAQILETPLLNQLNYQTLIATKASRVNEAGRGRPVLEYGLRRAPDLGANAGSRAALIGGADFTSNVGVSRSLGIPAKGTHAHSLVQVFMARGEGELGAFRAYAELYPDDCLLLVDTIDTVESGVPNAIRVFEELRRNGHEPVGIRLDSGDLAYLSIQAAQRLNEAGFPDVSIVISSNLDELAIWQIISQIEEEAPRYGVDPARLIGRLTYGVGTRLITSQGDSALDGVYKLVAIRQSGMWVPVLKVSEARAKIPNPGKKETWRFYDQRRTATADVLGVEGENPLSDDQVLLHHPTEHTSHRTLNRTEISEVEPLAVEVLREGELVYELPELDAIRARRRADLDRLDPGVRRLINPHVYHVSLTQTLWDLKVDSVEKARSPRSSGD
ncbi:MAG: nicotinate phosphoribosyltransferase [Acidimicrobiia bacterium]|nr:nicotinate phosphoribosyltransferase [Acidimicrobiia bacterium]MDH5615492.1 nicotinate phosphoribosyltransferase [Acidimicrobiia bacterium]